MFNGNPFACSKGAGCDGRTCWHSRLQQIRQQNRPRRYLREWAIALKLRRGDIDVPELYLPPIYKTRGAVCFGDLV